ncbi:MAG: histidine phosphatase family protein [Myxococcota bacterium]
MRILFLRHGERSHQGSDDPLTDHGRDMARAAGEWLRGQGLLPTVAHHTGTMRTRQTVELALASTGVPSIPKLTPAGMPRDRKGLEQRVAWLLAQGVPADALVLLVGSHTTQQFIEGHLLPNGIARIPSHNRAGAYLVEMDDKGAWKVTRKYDGSPTAPGND